MATTQAIFDLAARPEYIQPLRDEIQQVIDEDGQDLDGEGFVKLKKMSMPKLKKLDSFLKETQRLSPPGVGTCIFPPFNLKSQFLKSSIITILISLLAKNLPGHA